jgi:hypothetical protein
LQEDGSRWKDDRLDITHAHRIVNESKHDVGPDEFPNLTNVANADRISRTAIRLLDNDGDVACWYDTGVAASCGIGNLFSYAVGEGQPSRIRLADHCEAA